MPIFLPWIAACVTPTVEPVRAPIPPLPPGDAVFSAVVVRSPGVPAIRFTVPPSGWVTGDLTAVPPIGKVRHALCADLPGVRDAVVAALRTAEPDQREASFRYLFEGTCQTPEWCDWVSTTLAPDPREIALRGLWLATEGCAGADVDRLVLTDGPGWAVVDRIARTRIYDRRLESIASAVLDRPGDSLHDVLATLALVDDPAAEAALVALHRKAPRSVRDDVALSLWGRSSPAAIDLFAEACSRIDDRRCRLSRTDPLTALADTIEVGEDPAGLFVRYPNYEASLVSALSTCVEDGITPRPCLMALARRDRAAAASLAASVDEPAVADLAKVLGSDRASVLAALGELGFGPLTVPEEADALTVPELLEATGRAVRVADPHWTYPHNEQLLYALAALAGAPELELDELRPAPDAPEIAGRSPAITLYAWADGWRYRGLLPSASGWNVPVDVGFVNAVLAERDSDQRLALDIDQTHVIVGTADHLKALEDQGWVRLYHPPEPPPPEDAPVEVTPIVGEPVQLDGQ